MIVRKVNLMHFALIDSPLGTLLALAESGRADADPGAEPEALVGLHFRDSPHAPTPLAGWREAPERPVLRAVRRQLAEYFDGRRRSFDLPLRTVGTPFQRRVWAALRDIPWGGTTSYGVMAGRLGQHGAARAVGAANSRNPISIIVPCHRAIGADGRLTGYAGGLGRKRALLELEGAWPRRTSTP